MNILRVAEGTTLEAADQCVHITSGQVNGEEQLYLSPLCAFEAKKAVRGGILLIFPQFDKFEDGACHGFARTADWVQVPKTDTRVFSFTCALHTYIKIDDLTNNKLYGLKGLDYWNHGDVFDDRSIEAADYIVVEDKIDRMYFNTPRTIELLDGNRKLEFTSEGFQDTVVWNPGQSDAKRMSDLPDDGFKQMICIEPARVDEPISLEPGQVWKGRHVIRRN